jgi:acetyltransferase-like isoleucine patch superfamily enzyme
MLDKLRDFILSESTSLSRYLPEQIIQLFLSWIPSIIGVFLRAFFYKFLVSGQGTFYLQSGVILKNLKNIFLNDEVYIDHRAYINGSGGVVEIDRGSRIMCDAFLHVYNFRELQNSKIVIGKNTVVGPKCVIYGHGGAKIGNNVIMAARVSILPVNHHYMCNHKPIKDQGIEAKGIVVEDDVWLGCGAIITDGVTIGKGSVIGAGSVVTRDIPAFSLAVGIPARVIKQWGEV